MLVTIVRNADAVRFRACALLVSYFTLVPVFGFAVFFHVYARYLACSRCEEQALDHCYCVHSLEIASQRCRQAPTLPELGGHKSAARNAEAAKAQQYASIDATKKTRGQ